MRRSRTLSRLCAVAGTPADDDLEDLLLLEEGTDVEALHEGRGGAADVAGLDAVLPGRVEVDLDLAASAAPGRQLTRASRTPSTRATSAAHRSRLAIEDAEVLAVHPDREAVVARPEDPARPVALVGQDAAAHARVAADDPRIGGERPLVVGAEPSS